MNVLLAHTTVMMMLLVPTHMAHSTVPVMLALLAMVLIAQVHNSLVPEPSEGRLRGRQYVIENI